MKIFYLLIFTFSVFFLNAQIVDTSYSYGWQSNSWKLNGRTTYQYDNSCRLTSQLGEGFNLTTNSWFNSSLFLYSYVGTQNFTEVKIWNVNDSAFKSVARNTITRNASANISSVLYEMFNQGKWDSSSRYSHEFNSKGLVSRTTAETYDTTWHLTSYTTYTYASNGSEDFASGYQYDDVTKNWVNNYRSSTIHDKINRQDEITSETWNGEYWRKLLHEIRVFDENGHIIKQIQQFGDYATNNWIDIGRSTFTYNIDGTTKESIAETWQSSTARWENSNKNNFVWKAGCALPLKLLSFNGVRLNNKVQLSWRVANEVNTSHFVIERSVNGMIFTPIGTLAHNGQGENYHTYTFIDDDIRSQEQKVFYRLQIVDKDNTHTQSSIIMLQNQGNGISVFPNPVSSLLKITVGSPAYFRLYSVNGNHTKSGNLKPGVNEIDVQALSKGVYLLQITDNLNVVRTQKVILQ